MRQTLAFAFIILAQLSWAQSVDIKYGNPFAKDPDIFEITFNHNLQKGYVFSDRTVFELANYINHAESPASINFDASFIKKKPRVAGSFMSDGKMHLIYAAEDKERKVDLVYLQEMNGSGQLTMSPKVIHSFPTEKGIGNMFGLYTGDPIFENSTDVKILKPSAQDFFVLIKRRSNKVEAVGYHPTRGKIWEHVFMLDEKREHNLSDMEVASDGAIYICGSFYNGRMEEFEDRFVLAWSPITKIEKKHEFKSPKGIDDSGYSLSLINDIPYVAGVFGHKKEKKAGYKLYSINPKDFSLKDIATNYFTKEYYATINEGAYTSTFFGVADILALDNGNLVIDIEGGAASRLNRFTAPVYLSCVSPAGIEQWTSTIQKYQVQPVKGGLLGHVIATHNNKLYLFYNDDIDNFDLSPDVKPKDGLIKKNMYIAFVEVDEIGKSRKIKAFSKDKRQKIFFYPGSVYRIGENLFQLLIEKDGKMSFATLALP